MVLWSNGQLYDIKPTIRILWNHLHGLKVPFNLSLMIFVLMCVQFHFFSLNVYIQNRTLWFTCKQHGCPLIHTATMFLFSWEQKKKKMDLRKRQKKIELNTANCWRLCLIVFNKGSNKNIEYFYSNTIQHFISLKCNNIYDSISQNTSFSQTAVTAKDNISINVTHTTTTHILRSATTLPKKHLRKQHFSLFFFKLRVLWDVMFLWGV